MRVYRLGYAIAIGIVCGISGVSADAQGYPDKPINFVVPWPPGSSNDIVGRIVARDLERSLKQTVVVENKTGAAGIIGANSVAQARADGYTILFANTTTNAIQPWLVEKPPYTPADFAPVSVLATTPFILVVNRSIGVKTFDQLVALIKSKPGAYNYGTTGSGTPLHLIAEFVKQKKGLDIVQVNFRGPAEMSQALLNNDLLMNFDGPPSVRPFIARGEFVPLLVTGPRRLAELPDVPAMDEVGIDGKLLLSWYGLAAPARTPADVTQRLREAAVASVNSPETIERLKGVGATPWGSSQEEMKEFVGRNSDFWKSVISQTKLKQ